MTFKPEVTLGHVLQALVMLAALIGLWMNMDRRVTVVETRVLYMQDAVQQANNNQTAIISVMAEIAKSVKNNTEALKR